MPRVDFALTDEQSDFVDAIRDFCDRECGTQDQRERLTDGYREHHSFDLYKQMAELGWLGVTIPEEYGGSGGSMLDACLFMEETSRGLAPIGGYATTLIVAGATQRFGSEEQKAEILGGIASGSVEAIAMTEPEAGSDVGALACSAERVDGGFVLNGQKVFMLQRPHLRPRARRLPHDQDRVQARRDDDDLAAQGRRGDGDRPDRDDGRARDEPPLPDRLRRPRERRPRRGRPGLDAADGRPQRRAPDPRRDDARDRPARLRRRSRLRKERKQFGRPIGSFQALQHRFADLATDLEAARLMTRWVATLTDEDPDRMLPQEASMVKLFVTEVAKRTTLEGMQLMGGYGYSSEYDMERLVRTSLVSTIYGGTSEIQRGIIAKTLGL